MNVSLHKTKAFVEVVMIVVFETVVERWSTLPLFYTKIIE